MANTKLLESFIKGLADAVRMISGKTGLINPQNLPSEIISLTKPEVTKENIFESIGYSQELNDSVLEKIGEDLDYSFSLKNQYERGKRSGFSNTKLIYCPFIDTSDVTSMIGMFYNCHSLTTIPELDTSNVTTMNDMFYYCDSLTTIPELDTSNVTDMYGMFFNCGSLTIIPELDTGNVTNMNRMFMHCNSLTTIPKINTSNVTNMSGMFYNCNSLTIIPELDTGNVTDMSNMFGYCNSLTTIPELDTSNVTNMGSMFNGCESLTTIPKLDTSSVTDMSSMFSGCESLTTIPELDTSSVTNMRYMFNNCGSLTIIPELDTSNVIDMNLYTFYNCKSLKYLLIKNIGKLRSTTFDFSGAVVWGTGNEDNRKSLIDSLITYSYDRVNNGMSAVTIKLSSTTKSLLTNEEIAQITVKGYTIV